MKYRLLKPLPWIEVGTIYDSTTEDPVTKEEADIELFVRCFWTNNDFFEPIKESKWWEPKEWWEYYDFYGEEEFNNTTWDIIAISAWLAFKTKEEAEKQLKLMQAITRCRKYLVDRDMLLDDLTWRSYLYTIIYHQYKCELSIDWFPYIIYSPYWYINSTDNAKKFIEDCQEDLLLIHKHR